ncbi:acetamidase [Lysinibacillus odysseyi 34hs-1 = NBRC 100172]|uniref:Acetamidase n=2 Tax=Lysinibacillus odysseyi TaxID=202611 RepID=A0A0A3IWG9_9BACI|nr:acetamidase [Lysinibacillus odysseyi 34hs-1 = NBRC 100172]
MVGSMHEEQNELLSEAGQEQQVKPAEMLFINEFTDGIVGPENEFLGPLRDGGTIIANTAPGCWGPMLTPTIKGRHEVTKPVYIEGAEVGDSIVVEIESIRITSLATASGVEQYMGDRYISDPFLKVKCPGCGKLHPQTIVNGIGPEAIRCTTCNNDTAPIKFAHGYTMAFHPKGKVGVTVGKEGARKIGIDPQRYLRLPEKSVQNPVVSMAPSDLAGVTTRVRPFIAEIGTIPSKAIPASHNAGDSGLLLVDADHELQITEQELEIHRTDGHLHLPQVREGAILICPVLVKGGGLYLGDIHAMQGAGQPAGHASNVSGIVQVKVSLLKKVKVEGPVLLPNEEDLPYLAKPFTKEERKQARDIAEEFGMKQLEEAFPIAVVGTGITINAATDNALLRMAKLVEAPIEEVKNRVTLTGGVEIGRFPGLVLITAQFPKTVLKNARIFKYVKRQYD